jgi:hypothetical protein
MNKEQAKEFEKAVLALKNKKHPTPAEIKDLDKKEAELILLKRKFKF